jgi:hypothetical protein
MGKKVKKNKKGGLKEILTHGGRNEGKGCKKERRQR